MKCPSCKIRLLRIQYEGLNIRQCDRCRGHLLTLSRLKAIQTRRHKSEEALLEEIANEGPDSLGKLKCPECLRSMEKRRKRIGTLEFFVDHCHKCEFIWLDSGELAKLQILFEFSDKGEEAERFRQRLANMTAEEKTEMELRIAKLTETSLSRDVIIGLLTEFRIGRSPDLWQFLRN